MLKEDRQGNAKCVTNTVSVSLLPALTNLYFRNSSNVKILSARHITKM